MHAHSFHEHFNKINFNSKSPSIFTVWLNIILYDVQTENYVKINSSNNFEISKKRQVFKRQEIT